MYAFLAAIGTAWAAVLWSGRQEDGCTRLKVSTVHERERRRREYIRDASFLVVGALLGQAISIAWSALNH